MHYAKHLLAGCCLVTICLLLTGRSVLAQDAKSGLPDNGYKIGESADAKKQVTVNKNARKDVTKQQARLEDLQGNVTWRPDETASWQKARRKQHLGIGAQIWVTGVGHAELSFEDGSLLRLGNGAVVTLQTIARDAPDEVTRIKMSSGLATLLTGQGATGYDINTLFLNVKVAGVSRVRIGVADTVEVGVRHGLATVEGKQGKTLLHSGSFISVRSKEAPYDLRGLPRPDTWERWNDERDYRLH